MEACRFSQHIPWGRGVAAKARPPPRSDPPKFQRDCRPGPISRNPNTFAAPDSIRGPGACPERSRRADPKNVACGPWTPDLRCAPSGVAIEGGVRGRQGAPAPLSFGFPLRHGLEPKRMSFPGFRTSLRNGFEPQRISFPLFRGGSGPGFIRGRWGCFGPPAESSWGDVRLAARHPHLTSPSEEGEE